MKLLRNISFALSFSLALNLASTSEAMSAELIMLEQDGCHWCQVWNEEIGVAYPKTDEGKLAPLRRVNIHKDLPEDLKTLAKSPFTPTFVVWHEGREIDRLRGYPGAHFFWPMLQEMLKKIETDKSTDQNQQKS